MSFFTNMKADRLIADIKAAGDGNETDKSLERLEKLGPQAIPRIVDALAAADRQETEAFIRVLAVLIDNKSIATVVAALSDASQRTAAAIVTALSVGREYNPQLLLPLLAAPQAPRGPIQSVELSVPLVAPNLPGTYRNEWKLKVDNGPLVGVGPGGQNALYVQIVVPSNSPCTYRATFLGDVTIPDNSLISPGQPFRKTWRLRNDGTCAWGQNAVVHSVTNVNNNPLGAPNVIAMPAVPPGGMIDLSIDMDRAEHAGRHRSEWMFMVNEGGLRGVGPQGETPLYVQIVVPGLP